MGPGSLADKTQKMENTEFDMDNSSEEQYYLVLKAPNGEVILTSEMYTATPDGEVDLESMTCNGSGGDNRDRSKSLNNGYNSNFESEENGQVIGTLLMYHATQPMKNGHRPTEGSGNSDTEDLT